jgi:transposase
MKKIKLKNKHSIAELKTAIKKSDDEEQKTRLRVIIKTKKGLTRTAIAEEFTIDRTAIISWIKKYNEKGINGLIMSKGGRPEGNHKWDEEIFKKLTKEIKKGNQCWSLPLMQDWIIRKEKEIIPITTIWYHVKKLNFTYKTLRPHPYLGDKEKQGEFKKKD